MTVAYSKERVQFGRPIGSFQALKHRMADMLVLVEMTPLRRRGRRRTPCPGRPTTRPSSRTSPSPTASTRWPGSPAETIQLHGGIAITWEHDAHLVFKRAHALGQLYGSPRQHRTQVRLSIPRRD